MSAPRSGAAPGGAQALWLLARAEGAAGKLEVARAALRAAHARLRGRRGALHVRRGVVIEIEGLRYHVPPLDNSFASGRRGAAHCAVTRELLRLAAERPATALVDVGANLGTVAMTVAAANPRLRVVAVEPVPWLAAALRRTASLNGLERVTVVERAVGPPGGLELAIPVVDGVHFTTVSSSVAPPREAALTRAFRRIGVPTVGLDELLDELGLAPDALAAVKLDVEGAELAVLRTAGRALAARVPVIFEAHTEAARAAVAALLAVHGYRVRPLDGTNHLALASARAG